MLDFGISISDFYMKNKFKPLRQGGFFYFKTLILTLYNNSLISLWNLTTTCILYNVKQN